MSICQFLNCKYFLDFWDVGFELSRLSQLFRCRFLNFWDQDHYKNWDFRASTLLRRLFLNAKTFLTVETSFLKLSRLSWQSKCEFCTVKTVSTVSTVELSVFELSRLSQQSSYQFLNCQDQDSWLRQCWDKSRPPGLLNYLK